MNITQTHGPGDFFRFQLCPSTEISEQCFVDGEFDAFLNEDRGGLHYFSTRLPEGVRCEACVLRWKWDYAFLSCADIAIVPEPDRPLMAALALVLLGMQRRARRDHALPVRE